VIFRPQSALKTDSLFYFLFQTAPGILFELLGRSPEIGELYEFKSIELKQTAFRIDGVLVPSSEAEDQTVYFVEVQFQDDPYFYQRFFAEIFLYLRQNPTVVRWQAAVLFSKRSIEPQRSGAYSTLLNSAQVQRIYLEDLKRLTETSIGVGLIQLIVLKSKAVPNKAKVLLSQVNRDPQKLSAQAIVELIETIMVYKFPSLSREEIEKMLGLSELKQTRVYQEARQEGIQEGRQEGIQEGIQEGRQEAARSLILKLLGYRIGLVSKEIREKIQRLSIPQVEMLGEALLNFSSGTDLEEWMRSQNID
jgi:predicted transposase/invertase (TIGR01784 family)